MPDWKWLTNVLRYYLPELNVGDGEFLSMKKIIDQFTELPVSRQRKQQLRRKAKGLCEAPGCPDPPLGDSYCKKHLRIKSARLRRKFGLSPWRHFGPGRTPLERKQKNA